MYIIAYATNSAGIAYGNVLYFTTVEDITSIINYSSFTDTRDNKIYRTVTINGVEWMAENPVYLPSVSLSSAESIQEPFYHVKSEKPTDISIS